MWRNLREIPTLIRARVPERKSVYAAKAAVIREGVCLKAGQLIWAMADN